VTQRDVVGLSAEHVRMNRADPADADVALGLAGGPAGDERMSHHHGTTGPGHRVAAYPVHRRPQHRRMGTFLRPQPVGSHGRLKVGHRVDIDILDRHRRPHRAQTGPDVKPRPGQKLRGEAQANRRVVVAAGQHDDRAGIDEPGDSVREELHRVGGRQCPVVDVARDEHGVNAFRFDHLYEMIQVEGLGIQQPHPVEGPSEMPVRGMYEAHARRL
jgi:hypothetical protein